MATQNSIKPERQYYIDWLRILLILSVFLFHIGMIFNNWEWHVKNDVTAGYKSVLWYTMVFLHYWRMPLLFLISGAGTYYALGKRSPGQYLGERTKRLIIPLVAGIFILVPVQVYLEKSAHFGSLLDFYPHMFEGVYPSGNFSWHHLWFIAYLFIISLFISPLLNFFRGSRFEKFKAWLERLVTRPLALNLFMLPILLSQVLLRPYFPESTHGLVDDWASMAFYIIFFLAGFILLSNRSMVEAMRRQRYLYLLEGAAAALFMFTVPYMVQAQQLKDLTWDISSYFVAWSCGMAAIGFARQHMNKDSKLRKYANEAIYPFYLLHQPVIVVVAFYMTKWDITMVAKLIFILLTSFAVTISIYWILVRPFNFMRVIFGMKKINHQASAYELKWYSRVKPDLARISNSKVK